MKISAANGATIFGFTQIFGMLRSFLFCAAISGNFGQMWLPPEFPGNSVTYAKSLKARQKAQKNCPKKFGFIVIFLSANVKLISW